MSYVQSVVQQQEPSSEDKPFQERTSGVNRCIVSHLVSIATQRYLLCNTVVLGLAANLRDFGNTHVINFWANRIHLHRATLVQTVELCASMSNSIGLHDYHMNCINLSVLQPTLNDCTLMGLLSNLHHVTVT